MSVDKRLMLTVNHMELTKYSVKEVPVGVTDGFLSLVEGMPFKMKGMMHIMRPVGYYTTPELIMADIEAVVEAMRAQHSKQAASCMTEANFHIGRADHICSSWLKKRGALFETVEKEFKEF